MFNLSACLFLFLIYKRRITLRQVAIGTSGIIVICYLFGAPFFLSGFVIINTIFLFMIFDNTLRFTGLSFQVVYPILLHAGMNRMGWIRTFLLK